MNGRRSVTASAARATRRSAQSILAIHAAAALCSTPRCERGTRNEPDVSRSNKAVPTDTSALATMLKHDDEKVRLPATELAGRWKSTVNKQVLLERAASDVPVSSASADGSSSRREWLEEALPASGLPFPV